MIPYMRKIIVQDEALENVERKAPLEGPELAKLSVLPVSDYE